MLQKITIENFIKIPFIDLEPHESAVLIAGHNEAGKSSFAEAVRFALLEETPRVALKRDRPALLCNGAKKGSVTVTFDNATIRRNIKDGKVSGDAQFLPQDRPVALICLQSHSLATMADADRRALLLRLAQVDLSVDVIAEKMIEHGIPMDTVLKYRPLLKGGLKPAWEHARRSTTDARGAWKEVTGETYGSEKALNWTPPEPVVSTKEAESALADVDAQIAKERAARETALAPVLASIRSYEDQLSRPDPLACAHCGGALLYEDGELKAFEGAEKGSLQGKLSLARMKRQQISTEFDEKLQKLEEDRRTLQQEIDAAADASTKAKRAKELHEDVQTNDRIATLLSDGPDGIAAQLIAESLAPLNQRLREIGDEIGWTPVQIRGDMAIVRADGHPYSLLSKSAQWRADTMLQVLVSELAEFPWLIFDEMDLLAPPARPAFVQWIAQYGQARPDEPTIIVLATLKEQPNLASVPGIEAHWIESGQLERLGEAA